MYVSAYIMNACLPGRLWKFKGTRYVEIARGVEYTDHTQRLETRQEIGGRLDSISIIYAQAFIPFL